MGSSKKNERQIMEDKEYLEKNKDKRTLTEIFTRVMGYFRPVSYYNIGKKQEFKDRKWFKEKN